MALGGLGGGRGLLAGTAHVDIRPDLKTFGPRLKTELGGVLKSLKGEFKLDAFGSSLTKVGGTLTRNLTVPLAGAGAAVHLFGADFESVLTRMVNLAGVGADEIDGIRTAILKLAGETGRSPKELAEGLYEIRSSGLVGQAAMDALTTSAKAAAIGLGSTAVVASVVTSAVNAYASSNLTAADAGDILAATVREGKGSADEFAESIGRVIPVSSAMGVGLADVGAALATMTLSGLDANEATTALRGILGTLLAPSKEASDLLSSMGLSAEGLREQLRDKGLLSVLQTLAEKFKGNEEAAAGLFGNVRALTGFLNLSGQDAEKVVAIFARLHAATGTISDGFTRLQQDAKFKLQRSLADAQVALIKFGESVAPVASKLTDFAGTSFKFFAELPGPIKTSAVAFGGLLASVGPLSFLLGGTARSAGKLVGVMKGGGATVRAFALGLKGLETIRSPELAGGKLATGANKLARALGPVGLGAAVTGVGVAFALGWLALERWKKKKEEARQTVLLFTEALRLDNGEIGEHSRKLLRDSLSEKGLQDDLASLNGHLSSGRDAFDVWADAANGSVEAAREIRQAILDTGQAGEDFNILKADDKHEIDQFRKWVESGEAELPFGFHRSHPDLSKELEATTRDTDAAKKSNDAFIGSVRTKAQVDEELAAAQRKLSDLNVSGTASTEALTKARADVTRLGAEQARAEKDVADQMGLSTDQTYKQVTSLELLVDKRAEARRVQDEIASSVANVAAAQQALDDVRADAAGTGKNAIAAAEREEDALRGLADASRSAADAQDGLREARQSLADFESGTSATIRDLERQQILERLVTTPEEVRQKQIDLLKFDQDAASERKRLHGSVADAEQGVVDAADRVAEAQRNVVEASEERKRVQVEAAGQIAEKERDLRAAVDVVTDAMKELGEKGAKYLRPYIDALEYILKIIDPNSPLYGYIRDLIPGMEAFLPPTAGGRPDGRGGQGERRAGHYALGGSAAEGWSVVGEQGAELIRKQGSDVDIYSNARSREMLGEGAQHIDARMNVTINAARYMPTTRELETLAIKQGRRLARMGRRA